MSKKLLVVAAMLAVTMVGATGAVAELVITSADGVPYTFTGHVNQDIRVDSTGVVQSAATIRIDSTAGATLTIQGSWTAANLFEISAAATGIGTLTVDGGNLTATSLRVGRSGGTGYFNIYGGQAITAEVGVVNDNSRGYMTQTGGLFQITGNNGFSIATNSGNIGVYTISGGTLSMVDNDARYGYIKIGRSDGLQTSARFEIVGSLANDISCGGVQLYDTMAFALDDNGVTSIITKRLFLNSNSIIELSALAGTNVAAGTYDLITFETIYAGSFSDITLAAPTGWSLQLNGNKIQAVVTDIPEPATMALLGLGLTGLLARRRRR